LVGSVITPAGPLQTFQQVPALAGFHAAGRARPAEQLTDCGGQLIAAEARTLADHGPDDNQFLGTDLMTDEVPCLIPPGASS
jgi:hypothetical protein